jgi:hypothetical protein
MLAQHDAGLQAPEDGVAELGLGHGEGGLVARDVGFQGGELLALAHDLELSRLRLQEQRLRDADLGLGAAHFFDARSLLHEVVAFDRAPVALYRDVVGHLGRLQGGGGDELARVEHAHAPELGLGIVPLHFGLAYLRRGHLQLLGARAGAQLLQRFLARGEGRLNLHNSVPGQLFLEPDLGLQQGNLRLGGAEGIAEALHLGLEIQALQPGDQLADRHPVPLADRSLDDPPRHLEAHPNLGGLDGAGRGDEARWPGIPPAPRETASGAEEQNHSDRDHHLRLRHARPERRKRNAAGPRLRSSPTVPTAPRNSMVAIGRWSSGATAVPDTLTRFSPQNERLG